jgi:hypothetical protein
MSPEETAAAGFESQKSVPINESMKLTIQIYLAGCIA